MSQDALRSRIRRILVALDASSASIAALEGAADLAARLDAELSGLFVEDEDLLRLAGLPFAAEVEIHSATSRPLTAEAMEQSLRAQARRAESALSGVAERHGVRWDFRVVRGAVTTEVLAAMEEADFAALGGIGGRATGGGRVGDTALEAILKGERPVLLLAPGGTLCEPIAALYSEHPSAGQTLDIAARLAQRDSGHLLVILLAASPAAQARLEREARARLEAQGVTPSFRPLGSGGPWAVVGIVRKEHVGTAVLTGDPAPFGGDLAVTLVEEQRCAVILVR